MSDPDPLTQRALQARASLQEATSLRPVPSLGRPRVASARRVSQWATPVLAAAVAAAVVLGGFWGGSQAPRRVVGPGAVTSVGAGQLPVATATDGRLVWVADAGSDDVVAFDAHTLRRQWTTAVGARPVAIAHGLGAIWVVLADGAQLLKLDPRTGRVLRTGRTSLDPIAVDVSFGAVWVLSAGNETLDRYDATTVAQTGSAVLGASGRGLAHSRDSLWVTVPRGVRRVDPAGAQLPVSSVPLGGDPRGPVVVGGDQSVWVLLSTGGIVTVDGVTGTARGPVALGAPATAMTTLGDTVVVATADGGLQQFARPAAAARILGSTGVPADALSAAGALLVGTARVTALLYATEVAP